MQTWGDARDFTAKYNIHFLLGHTMKSLSRVALSGGRGGGEGGKKLLHYRLKL